MPLALLVTLVGVTLSASLTGLVVAQIRDSARAAERVAAVAAAQAGLDTGLARIRAAISSISNVEGVLSDLPCDLITGALPKATGGATQAASFSTSVGYFVVNPSGMVGTLAPIGDLTNLNTLAAGASVNALLGSLGKTVTGGALTTLTAALQSSIGCVNGIVSQVPLFGLLRSTGKVGSTTRTLYGTYTFRTTQETISGGRIPFTADGSTLCLGGANNPPVTGDPVKAVACTLPEPQTYFIYPKNLSLTLASSRTVAARNAGLEYGLCVTSPLVPSVNAPVTFAPCTALKIPTQQWRYEVNAKTYYGTTNGVSDNGFCLGKDASNTIILTKTGCGNNGSKPTALTPASSVGSGSAGTNTGQFVNYEEFGRCLDLTNEDPTGNWFTSRGLAPALIVYPCKQTFTSTVYWNHKWTIKAIPAGDYKITSPISITPTNGSYAGKTYCLKSPGATGGYVWVSLCDSGLEQQWTVWGAAPQTSDSYQVVDQYGNCLMAAGSLGAAYQYSGWSEAIATKCDGSYLQKWNAPRSLSAGPLTGIQER